MGFGGISIWQLVIVLIIVVLLFGTKKLKNLGKDFVITQFSFIMFGKINSQNDMNMLILISFFFQ